MYWINMPLYANLNMHKYVQNMHIYAKICSDPISISPMHSYAFICTKYAKLCKICKHESYMQHLQNNALPTLLMPLLDRDDGATATSTTHVAPDHDAIAQPSKSSCYDTSSPSSPPLF